MEIQGKVVLITGASAGIGLATARRFAAEGAKVVLAARRGVILENAVNELRQNGCSALAVATDMRDPVQVKHLVDDAAAEFGRIDVVINNAGQSVAGAIASLSLDDFRQVMELNVYAPVYLMQLVIPLMRQNGGGMIVNISSMVSKMSIPGLGGYASTKAALNLISDTARGELAADHIRVVTVYPKTTETDFGKNALGNRELRAQQRNSAREAMRLDTPEFVAGKILEAVQKEPAEQLMNS
jgi:NAD(P)-dependent dehydrogenase (short-subunit alcohol dehydrogenase family)